MYIYELHGNHKTKTYNRHTHTQKRKETKHNTKHTHQITWEGYIRKNKNMKNKKNSTVTEQNCTEIYQ